MTVAIIGAGISGVSAGRILKEKGHEVTIFEKAPAPGGLVRCERKEGHLFHLTGGHVFNAKDQVVNDWFWNLFDRDTEFIKAKRKAKILLGGELIGYPIENYIYALDKTLVKKILSEVLELHAAGYKRWDTYDNFASFLKGNFGETLYRLYFQPYNEKIWRTDLSQIPMTWLEGKLPMPNLLSMLLSNVIKEEEDSMVHSTFFYPKEGGSQFIIDRIASGLNIRSNSVVRKIRFEKSKWRIDDQLFDKVVYTGDVRALYHSIEQVPNEVKNSLSQVTSLKSNGTSNVLCETDDSDLSWLYLPGPNVKAHRIIYTGNFSLSNNSTSTRKSCVVEFSGKQVEAEMRAELKKLPGQLNPIAFNYEANSYIIQDHDTSDRIDEIKKYLEPLNFYLSGRFAEWEYYNMDKAILSSLTKFSREF